MVVVSPLPRYVKDSCCPDAGHIPNRKDRAFYYTLKEELRYNYQKFPVHIRHAVWESWIHNGTSRGWQ